MAREAIDDAILSEFTERHLSLEATRSRRRAKREADAALATRALADAESDLARAEHPLARVRGDYKSGEITAAEWRDLRGEIEAERDAAVAAVERARAQAEVTAADEADDEAQVLRRLSQLRDLALGRLDSAPDLKATRTLLRQIFERVIFVNVNGAARLYPAPHSEQFVVQAFFDEHGRLPEPDEHPGPLDEMKRVPLPLALSEAGPKSLV